MKDVATYAYAFGWVLVFSTLGFAWQGWTWFWMPWALGACALVFAAATDRIEEAR